MGACDGRRLTYTIFCSRPIGSGVAVFTFQQLKYFCAAYGARSLNKAADELFLTRQALSKSLCALEREVGGQLFERGSDGIQPTLLADELYTCATDVVARSERLFEQARCRACKDSYRLRVGSTFSALETTFPLLPIEFGDTYPNIELEVIEAPDLELEERVIAGRLDAAFVIGPASKRPELRARCVHREGLGLLMRRDAQLAAQASVCAEDLAGVPLLVVSPQFKAHKQLLNVFAHHEVQPNIRYASSDFSLLVKMCEMGEGAVPLPISRRNSYENGNLVLVPLEADSDPGWQIDFVSRLDVEGTYALALFEDFLFGVR